MADEYLYAHLKGQALLAGKMAWQQTALEAYAAWAEACCTEFVYAFIGWAGHYVSGLIVASCKLELADAAGLAAHAQQGATTSNW